MLEVYCVYLVIYSIDIEWAHDPHGYHDKQDWGFLHEINNDGNNQIKIITYSKRWVQHHVHFSQFTYRKYNYNKSLYIACNFLGTVLLNYLQQPCNR